MMRLLTGLLIAVWTVTPVAAVDQRAIDAVSKSMVSVAAKNWDVAATDIEPAGQVGLDIVTWFRLRTGKGIFAEYQDFLERREDWPGLPLMRQQGERSIPKSATARDVFDYFETQKPRTGTGALRLISALDAQGKENEAKALAINSWTTLSLYKSEQAEFLRRFDAILKDHHTRRLDMLLWRGKTTEATRMNALVGKGHRALSNARIGLMKKAKGVDGLVTAVPKSLRNDPGLAHARFTWRVLKGRTQSAIELLLAQSTSAEKLGQPDEWSNRRRSLAREMMRKGKPEIAYQLASRHFMNEGSNYADLEWLAGFIALSDLNDPKAALGHFQRFRVAVDTPISLGRAGYWEGRAYEAMGKADDARVSYEFAGEYQTSFYGQLAAEKVGLPMDAALTGQESYVEFHETPHWDSSVMQAAMLFQKAGKPLLFTRFIRHLAETLTPEERGSLAQLALDLNETYAALYMAKYAARNGDVLMRAYFPVTSITDRELPVSRELALAIVRRESEFFPGSKSHAGARGLMQLMPRTGKAMAQKLGLKFNMDRLVTDPVYNAKLGSAYLAELIDEFGPAFPMVAAGYNAGPSRPKTWARLYGDPRSSEVDAVDWVEHIPFRETRNYVMRVMESLPVYRARLTGKVAPLRLSEELKGR